jgi:hypothetical protein
LLAASAASTIVSEITKTPGTPASPSVPYSKVVALLESLVIPT